MRTTQGEAGSMCDTGGVEDRRRGSTLATLDTLLLVGVVTLAVVVVWWIVSAIVGTIVFAVKVALVVGAVVLVVSAWGRLKR
jgi:hypothetical protein